MPLGTPCPAPTHVPSTDPTALLRHGGGQEGAPREVLHRREHAGSSVLPAPCRWGICVLETLRAISSHKGGVIATNCKGPQRGKQSCLPSPLAKAAPGQALRPNRFSSGQSALITKSHRSQAKSSSTESSPAAWHRQLPPPMAEEPETTWRQGH